MKKVSLKILSWILILLILAGSGMPAFAFETGEPDVQNAEVAAGEAGLGEAGTEPAQEGPADPEPPEEGKNHSEEADNEENPADETPDSQTAEEEQTSGEAQQPDGLPTADAINEPEESQNALFADSLEGQVILDADSLVRAIEDASGDITLLIGRDIELESNITFEGDKNITFIGTNEAGDAEAERVISAQSGCNLLMEAGNITLSFIGVRMQDNVRMYARAGTNLHITGLAVSGATTPLYAYAGATVTLERCSWHNNNPEGGTIGVINSKDAELHIIDSVFENNTASVIRINGGLLKIEGTLFEGNSAYTNGGAINADKCEIEITGSSFQDNWAGSGLGSNMSLIAYGGAIKMELGKLTIEETTLSGNRAYGEGYVSSVGGGIYAVGSELTLNKGTLITDNYSPSGAGVYISIVSSTKSKLTIAGKADNPVRIINNRGIGMLAGSCEVDISHADISGNATGATGYGGGIQFSGASGVIKNSVISGNRGGRGAGIYSGNSTIRITSSTISNNISGVDGGAVYVQGGLLELVADEADMLIHNNEAEDRAGAIFVNEATSLKVWSERPQDTQVKFIENKAPEGGAVYAFSSAWANESSVDIGEGSIFTKNEAADDGGAIYIKSARAALLVDGAVFKENTAGNYGGGIYAYQAKAEVNNSLFDGNETDNLGGAVFVWNTTDAVKISNSLFEKNTTKRNGAAIYSSSCDVKLTDTELKENAAAGQGGAVYAYLGTLALDGAAIAQNTAGDSGGGLFLYTITASLRNTEVTLNEAGGSGGGIYSYGSVLDYQGTAEAKGSIAGNISARYGGGIYIEGAYNNTASKLHYLNFEGNKAFNGGGIAARGQARINGGNQTFKDNTAEHNGGAVSVSQAAIEAGGVLLNGVSFEGNTARLPVNVLSRYDYDLFGQLVTGGVIKNVTGNSLGGTLENGRQVPEAFYYLGDDGQMQEITDETYKAYNNFDIAYHELIYSIVYKLHNGADKDEIADANFYGSGYRATNAGTPTLTAVKLTDMKPQYEYKDDGGTLLEDINASMTFAGWAQSLEMPLLAQNAQGAPVIDLGNMEEDIIYLHARYQPTVLTVSFNANGGAFDSAAESAGAGTFPAAGDFEVLDVSVQYGGDIDEPSAYVSNGEKYFAGWYTAAVGGELANLTNVKKNQTVYAHWIDLNAGEFIAVYYMDETAQETYYSQTYTAPKITQTPAPPAIPGYQFTGWYELETNNPLNLDKEYAAGDIVRFYAGWELGKYNVKIVNSSDSHTKMFVRVEKDGQGTDNPLDVGSDYVITDVTLEDKIYLLRDEGIYFVDYVPLTTIHAEYELLDDGSGFVVHSITSEAAAEIINNIRKYTVRFYADEAELGTDGYIADFTVPYGQSIEEVGEGDAQAKADIERLMQLTKTGYNFNGWIGQAETNLGRANDTGYLTMPVTSNINYYAVWEEADDGSIPDENGGDGDGDGNGNGGGGSGSGGGNNTDDKEEEQNNGSGGIALDKENHFAYIVGYPGGEVRPNAHISREEAATIFFRLLTQESRAELWSKRNPFSDVAGTRWSNNAVSTMANGDILKGYPDNTFRPEAGITRAELAAIAVRFEEAQDMAVQAQFSDTAGHWAEREIALAAELGYVNGYADGAFRPDAQITRAEVVVMLNRVLGRQLQSADDLLRDMQVWTDNTDTSAWYYLDMQEATHSQYYEMKADGIHKRWTALRESPDWTLLERADATADVVSW